MTPSTVTARVRSIAAECPHAIGYDSVDGGPLSSGRAFDAGSPAAYGTPYGPLSDENGTPASAGKIRAALAASS
jgi:hypothetical protein